MHITPIFRVFDYAKTIEFYINFLGCTLNWEHHPENTPFYLQVTLRDLPFHLSEHHGDCSPGGKFVINDFVGLAHYHQSLLEKNYPYNRPGLERIEWAPDTLEMEVIDPFNNRIIFTEKVKNFNSISPSALSLLFLKSHTQIPFISEAVHLIGAPKETPEMNTIFWARVLHFETRYWSIDQLLQQTGITNILEISSGYSFRGLDMATNQAVHYIDTDLEAVISHKQQLVNTLKKELKGHLQLSALNALDEARFEELVRSFPAGPVAIVNEGLLMYLNTSEKQQLCAIIHKILKQRGGCWITADIYIPSPIDSKSFLTTQQQAFFAAHNIEENKFASFEAAAALFHEAGFDIAQTATVPPEKLTALEHFPAEVMEGRPRPAAFRTTWMLTVK